MRELRNEDSRVRLDNYVNNSTILFCGCEAIISLFDEQLGRLFVVLPIKRYGYVQSNRVS